MILLPYIARVIFFSGLGTLAYVQTATPPALDLFITIVILVGIAGAAASLFKGLRQFRRLRNATTESV